MFCCVLAVPPALAHTYCGPPFPKLRLRSDAATYFLPPPTHTHSGLHDFLIEWRHRDRHTKEAHTHPRARAPSLRVTSSLALSLSPHRPRRYACHSFATRRCQQRRPHAIAFFHAYTRMRARVCCECPCLSVCLRVCVCFLSRSARTGLPYPSLLHVIWGCRSPPSRTNLR